MIFLGSINKTISLTDMSNPALIKLTIELYKVPLDEESESGSCSFFDRVEKLSDEDLEGVLKIATEFTGFATNRIYNEMYYRMPHQQGSLTWAGDYCGRCNYKSRSYEGGKCSCNYEVKDFSRREKIIKNEYIFRKFGENAINAEDLDLLMKELVIKEEKEETGVEKDKSS